VKTIQERLRALSPEKLLGMRRGIEKESLRVRAGGGLADTPHPAALGSALAHPNITTDFSEAQLELITGVHPSAENCLEELTLIHQAVTRAIGEELLWCASMPCGLPDDELIPIGRYGSSNLGRAKTVYRMGLSYRYGRRMQAISGIHYNFSLPGVDEAGYFALARNFRRHAWLVLYLFGASPAVCSSFVEGRKHSLEVLKGATLYLPHATSLRMGRLGYQSEAQASLAVSYNSLESYGASLERALTTSYPAYEAIGVRGPDGEYRQLATTLLQIENEFYTSIRPKCTIRSGERPLHALRERGVEYVEARLMDLDPFAPVGIGAPTMRFLDLFLLHSLLAESPPDTPRELEEIAQNKLRAAHRGREPGLRLVRAAKEVPLAKWGAELLAECEPIAEALDAAFGGRAYREALSAAAESVRDAAATPSARVLAAMAKDYDNSYVRFALSKSLEHRDTIRALRYSADAEQRFARLAAESLEKQRQIEASDRVDFETWRREYLATAKLHP